MEVCKLKRYEGKWEEIEGKLFLLFLHSARSPFLLGKGWRGTEVKPPTKFSKGGGLTGSQFLERGCWEKRGGGNLFQEGGVFT